MTVSQVRRVSAKLLGNEKAAEVVTALRAESGAATAQLLAKRTGVGHSLVRDVLVRLADAGVVTVLPRPHSRAALYYEAKQGSVWTALLLLAEAIVADYGPLDQEHAGSNTPRHESPN